MPLGQISKFLMMRRGYGFPERMRENCEYSAVGVKQKGDFKAWTRPEIMR